MRKMERYVRLQDEKEDIVRRINEAKERGDHSEADKIERNELWAIDDHLDQLEREMSPTYSIFREECEEDC